MSCEEYRGWKNHENQVHPSQSLKRERPRVAFIGRWEPRKGSSYLPAIISRILDSGIEVTIVGGDPFLERGKALSKLKNSHKKSLNVLGVLEKNNLHDIYKNSDAVIIPSVYESFGLVAIEALLAGSGIVAFSGSGIEESVGACVNAEFSAVGDVEDFAQKTVKLADRIFNNSSVRNESSKYVEANFSLDKISEIFLRYLSNSKI